MKINCLETAKKAYKEDIDNQEIESVYDALLRHAKTAEKTGSNILEEMNNFSTELTEANERANKENLLQQLISMQAIVDNLQREELFRAAGHTPEQSVTRSLIAKMTGSTYRVARSRDNTYTRKIQASDGFYREFAEDIKGPLTPLFISKTGQVELADAMYSIRRGQKVDSAYGKLAEIVIKYQDRFYDRLRSVGVDITELDDRIAPNIHNIEKMMKLSDAEKKEAVELYAKPGTVGKINQWGDPYYEYAFQRWNRKALETIDHDKVFKARNVDPTNAKQVEAFQREAWDNLVNKGKVSQRNTNFANKFKKSRVYHWKDGASLIDYNNTFGNDAIQDSILRELSHGFGMIEVIRDWGVNPETTIDRTLNIMEENPIIKQRFNKELEAAHLKGVLRAMIASDVDYQGTVATIANTLKSGEVITKLGNVAITSVTDLAGISKVARQSGRSFLHAISNSIKNFIFGMSKADQAILYKYVNTGISNKLGSLARYAFNPYKPTSKMSQYVHWMFKLNFLERADNGNRGYVASVVSQHIAKNRNIPWEKLPESDKEIMGMYGIQPIDWEFIRNSNVKIGSRNKQFITPDSIQEMSDERMTELLAQFGVIEPSKTKIQAYKDSIERKLSTYFRDRIEHAIVTPDAFDKYLFTFGVPPERQIARAAIGVMLQFKQFGVAAYRRQILTTLREGGATNNLEMLYGGKSNWKGISILAVEMMGLAFVSMTLENAAKNLTPPGLDKPSTWWKMIKKSAGIWEIALNLDPKDLTGSLAKTAFGPVGSDAAKVARLGYNFATETAKGRGYQKTNKSAFQLVRGLIPFNTFMTKWLVNHFWLNGWEESSYPGKRQRDLRHLKQDTGATPLF